MAAPRGQARRLAPASRGHAVGTVAPALLRRLVPTALLLGAAVVLWTASAAFVAFHRGVEASRPAHPSIVQRRFLHPGVLTANSAGGQGTRRLAASLRPPVGQKVPATLRPAAPSLPLAAAAALGPTLLGFWKREYGVSYGYGGAIALIAALALWQRGPPTTALAAALAGVHLLYGVRLTLFLLYREICIARFRKFREKIEERAPSSRLSRTPFIISCSLLYLWMSAPVLLVAGVPEIGCSIARSASWAGVAAAALGFLVAAIGDIQKSIVKARCGENALVTTGVFKYLRHPNYTGELLLWSSSTFVGIASTVAYFSWPRLGGVAASLLGLLGIGFVLARAAANLEKRQRETYGSDPVYKEWLKSSWAGVTLKQSEEAKDVEKAGAAAGDASSSEAEA